MPLPKRLKAFVKPITAMCASQFPRKCSCGRNFDDFPQYIRGTAALGPPQCSCLKNDPFGLLSFRNCSCGSTLVLNCTDPEAHAQFCRVLKEESKATGRSARELLSELRSEIHSRVLGARRPPR
ncbi:MAG TPA: hypothetical protein PL037_02760 [Elusimicrobiales bacterium]|nr:hypothetical protein [Elusimicrobiales bacterium]